MFRTIYEPRSRAREYCDLAINVFTGCTHGCAYCYAPSVLHITREEFSMNVKARPYYLEKTIKQLEKDQFKNKKIMFCFVCDPYPAGVDSIITRDLIRVIKDSGNNIQILTKGGYRACRDFDLLDERDSFGVTIACSEKQRQKLEPNAAPIEDRLDTLKEAKKFGIKTWVSCEPVYDTQTVYDIIQFNHNIDLYRIGKLNYLPSKIDWKLFGKMCERLCTLHGKEYYIKEDLRAYMEG